MSKILKLIVAVSLLIGSVASSAEGLIGSVGYAERDQIKGVEIEIGYRKRFGAIEVDFIPLSGIFYQDDESRYRTETFSNGAQVCRDTSNGQFADKDECSASFSYAAVLVGNYPITSRIDVGAGLRIGKHTDVFATARYLFSNSFGVQVRAGGKYTAVALSLGF